MRWQHILRAGLGVAVLVSGGLLTTIANAADVESGPAADSAVKAFPVFGVVGDVENKETDYVKARGGKPTIWYFVTAEKWSRPSARLLRTLDSDVVKTAEDGQIIAIWLTEDVAKSKEYLPVCQQSIKLQNTSYGVYEKDPQGPIEWGLNTDAEVTVVVTRDGKVVKSFPYESVNATVAKEILAALKPTKKAAE